MLWHTRRDTPCRYKALQYKARLASACKQVFVLRLGEYSCKFVLVYRAF